MLIPNEPMNNSDFQRLLTTNDRRRRGLHRPCQVNIGAILHPAISKQECSEFGPRYLETGLVFGLKRLGHSMNCPDEFGCRTVALPGSSCRSLRSEERRVRAEASESDDPIHPCSMSPWTWQAQLVAKVEGKAKMKRPLRELRGLGS